MNNLLWDFELAIEPNTVHTFHAKDCKDAWRYRKGQGLITLDMKLLQEIV